MTPPGSDHDLPPVTMEEHTAGSAPARDSDSDGDPDRNRDRAPDGAPDSDRDGAARTAVMAVSALPVATRQVRARKQRPVPVTPDAARPEAAPQAEPIEAASAPVPIVSKLDRLLDHLRQPGGATIADLMAATGWQAHSVRGAMAGALRKKGHSIVSEKPDDGTRRYRTLEPS